MPPKLRHHPYLKITKNTPKTANRALADISNISNTNRANSSISLLKNQSTSKAKLFDLYSSKDDDDDYFFDKETKSWANFLYLL